MTDINDIKQLLTKEMGASVITEFDAGEEVSDVGGAPGETPGSMAPMKESSAAHLQQDYEEAFSESGQATDISESPNAIQSESDSSPGAAHVPKATDRGLSRINRFGDRPVEEVDVGAALKDIERDNRPKFNPVNFKRLLDPKRTTLPPMATMLYDSDEFTFLKRGEVVNLAGEAGVGKSNLMMDIIRAATHENEPTVGGVRFAQGSCLVVDEEGDEEILAERCALFGLNLEALEGKVTYLLNEGVRLDVEDLRDELFRMVQARRPDYIFGDARVRLSAVEENDAGGQARLYNAAIKPLARTFGCTVILLDHANKPGMQGPKMTDHRIRGSSEKTAQVDRNWLLSQYTKVDDQTGVPTRDELIWAHGKTRRSKAPPNLLISRDHRPDGQLRHSLKRVIGG